MKTLSKTNGGIVPRFNKWFDNFWDADSFFTDDFFNRTTGWLPAVNISEEDDAFMIELAAPGLKKNDFSVEVENGLLSISVKKEEKKEEKEPEYTRREFNFRSFNRTFTLPENVDPKSIKAKYMDGVLKLELVKLEVTKPEAKKIEIG